jgi:uncharacterized protein YciI
MFIILISYIKPLEQVMQFREQHINFLKGYYSSGRFLISGPKDPMDGGVIISLGKNIEEVSGIASQDPFYINGVATFSIIEFTPKWYNSYVAPFAKSGIAITADVDLTQYI